MIKEKQQKRQSKIQEGKLKDEVVMADYRQVIVQKMYKMEVGTE